jgi:benzoyl-CoA-dihydrodiol lyase
MPNSERKLSNGNSRIDFQTDSSKYRHWKIAVEGEVATLLMDVDEKGTLFEGYELKLNSYDLGVDIELADAIERLRFEHPQVKVILLRSAKPRVFCAGANIRMLAGASHEHKVNFCKFTNETRNGIEDASESTGISTICVINGTAAGGGFELALAADHIILVDDGYSAVSLPELPLLAVLPGTGGLTRVTDKRKVRRDLADVFCTTEEGVKGKRAADWRLVDEVVTASRLEETVKMRAREFAARSRRPASAKGVMLTPLKRTRSENGVDYELLSVEFRRADRLAIITLRGPDAAAPASVEAMIELGARFWPLQLARELDDAILDIRANEFDLAAIVFKSSGEAAQVMAYEQLLDAVEEHWLAREIRNLWKRVLKRIDLTSRSLVTLIEPGSCFAGTLAELVFAADRSYMLIGKSRGGDNKRPAALALAVANFAAYPMSNGLSRLASRFLADASGLDNAKAEIGNMLEAETAQKLGLVTFALDDIDWEDEIRLFLEERASFSADALTGMEANLRFAGPETMESKIFARLTAWQNWIFQRANAVGEQGALKRYGSGQKPVFDTRRV